MHTTAMAAVGVLIACASLFANPIVPEPRPLVPNGASLWHLVQGLELARRFEGYDGFQKASGFYYSRLAYELHQPYPGLGAEYRDEVYATEGDGSNTYGGRIYEASKGPLNKAAHRWRIEVKPASAQLEDLFVHVLSTDRSPAATATLAPGGRVTVKDTEWAITLDASGAGSIIIGGKTCPWTSSVKLGKFE